MSDLWKRIKPHFTVRKMLFQRKLDSELFRKLLDDGEIFQVPAFYLGQIQTSDTVRRLTPDMVPTELLRPDADERVKGALTISKSRISFVTRDGERLTDLSLGSVWQILDKGRVNLFGMRVRDPHRGLAVCDLYAGRKHSGKRIRQMTLVACQLNRRESIVRRHTIEHAQELLLSQQKLSDPPLFASSSSLSSSSHPSLHDSESRTVEDSVDEINLIDFDTEAILPVPDSAFDELRAR